jgi:hypothetical protein
VPAWQSWAALAAQGSYGVTPGVAYGGLLRIELERGSFALAVEAGAEAPTSAPVPVRGQVQAWSADARMLGCARLAVLVGCGFVSVGPLFTRGVGLSLPRAETVVYGAAGPRLGLELPLGHDGGSGPTPPAGRFRVEVFAQFAFALVPRELQVDGRDVFHQPRAAPSVGVGGSARIF